MNRLYGRPEWKKRWRWGLLGILAVFFLIIGGAGGVLLFPYLNLPPVTEEELDRMDLEGFDRIMIVAHPDDELLWGGGHLLGGDYLVVCLTGGNQPVRRAEFEAVMKATGDRGLILSYPDKIGHRRSEWKLWRKDMEADLTVLLRYKDWKAVVTHNQQGEYGHQHHKMTSESVRKVYDHENCGGQLWLFGQYYRKNKLPYDMKQMDQAVCRQKKQIAELYASQESTIRKLSHMMPYENWTTEN